MIHQVVVDDRFTVAIGINGFSENIRSVQSGCGREPDFKRVEIIEHPPVFRNVILVAAETQLIIAHLAIKQVSPVAFVNNDAIVLIDLRFFSLVPGIENAHNHTLDGCDLNRCLPLRAFVLKLFDCENIGKLLQACYFRILKGICGLLTQSGSINKKQNPSEALGFEKPIN